MSEELRVEPRVAAEFLASLYPDLPWYLVSFVPDGAPKTARMLVGRDDQQTRDWIGRMNGVERRNLYYQVNPLFPDADKVRASLTTVAAIHHLHVDIDPRAKEPKDEFLARVLPMLEKPPGAIPRPSRVVLSGSGVNALWALETPIPLRPVGADAGEAEQAASEAVAREACRYNYELELAFGADSCHDAARVLRLPGTVNWPNQNKRNRGRVPCVASVLWSDAVKYPLSAFKLGPVPGGGTETTSATSRGPSRTVKAPANVAHLGDVDKVMKLIRTPDGIGDLDKIARVILHGKDPQDPSKYQSGSEPMWFVACALVRGGLSDDELFAVLTDPALGVSAHVRRQGSPAKYALRQIERARTHAEASWLCELNDRYTVIGSLGGQCMVVEEVPNAVIPGRFELDIASFESFSKKYCNKLVQGLKVDKRGNPVMEEMGKAWLHHPRRAYRERVVFAPERETPDDYNLWRGFAYVPRVGDRHLPFLAHIRDNVCERRPDLYDYVIKWMATAVQHPAQPGHVAIVLRGAPGTGKGTLAKVFGQLWGRHFVHVQQSEHLVGKFNGHLRTAIVLFADECFWAGDKKHEGTLKTMITEESLPIEDKYARVDAGAPNFIHLFVASNENWVVPVGVGDRRFCVIDVSRERMQDSVYFEALMDSMKADDGLGFSHLLHHLQHLDLTGFNVRTIPATAAREEQKLLSLTVEQEWWHRKLEDGEILRSAEKWGDPAITRLLFEDYARYAQLVGQPRKSMQTALALFLRKMCPAGWPKKRRGQVGFLADGPGGTRVRETSSEMYYLFPPLAECRKTWDDLHGAREWTDYPDDGTVF